MRPRIKAKGTSSVSLCSSLLKITRTEKPHRFRALHCQSLTRYHPASQ
jgi:hypothetical protein